MMMIFLASGIAQSFSSSRCMLFSCHNILHKGEVPLTVCSQVAGSEAVEHISSVSFFELCIFDSWVLMDH